MHPPSRCPDREKLRAFLQQTASGVVRQEVEEHLRGCAPCQTLVQRLTPVQIPTHSLRPMAREAAENFSSLQTAVGGEVGIGPLLYPFLLPADRPDDIGRLGNYRVRRLLGKGGMGYVFLAEDVDLCRPVALKVMKPEMNGDANGGERFLREARAMASIKHDALVTVFQVGREQDVVFLAMELLEGRTLEDWLARVRRPTLSAILQVGKNIAGGLAAIHRGGLIHRDVKPANLWMEEPGERVKILDFGLARFVNDDANVTQAGMILGTPSFMSPEQARGETLDARSDLFSFGCVLYNLCTGTNPFHAKNTTAVLTALAVHNPSPVRQLNADIPQALSELVTELLEKRREDRPPSAAAVLERLKRIEEGKAVRAPARPPAPAADTDATLAIPPEKEPAPTAGWGKLGLTIGLAFAVTFAVPFLAATALRHNLTGATASVLKDTRERIHLTALDPIHKVNWPFIPPPKPGAPRKSDPGEVIVQGRSSPNGIFMHPPPAWEGAAHLTYSLRGEYDRFQAEVALNDGPPESESPFTFAVYGDGKLLWKSMPISRPSHRQACSVPVKGVDRLKIEVQSEGDPRGAHAVWIEPHLTK